MTTTTPPPGHPLPGMLEIAVPLYMQQFRSMSPDAVRAMLDGVADMLGAKGDVLLYGSKRKGETGELFNCVARAVAAMAFFPGGVTVFGTHYEATWDTEQAPEAP